MADKDDSVRQDGWARAQVSVPDDVAAAAQDLADQPAESKTGRPPWAEKFVWQSLWKAVGVVLITLLALAIAGSIRWFGRIV